MAKTPYQAFKDRIRSLLRQAKNAAREARRIEEAATIRAVFASWRLGAPSEAADTAVA